MFRYLHDIKVAIEAIRMNKLQSFLTALGIIFGVAAVISMLAIGNGARQEILEQMKLVGVNNIVIQPLEKNNDSENSQNNGATEKQQGKGLDVSDIEAIASVIPLLETTAGEIRIETTAILNAQKININLVGVSPQYFQLFDLELFSGNYFNDIQNDNGKAVCVIGNAVEAKFFRSSAIGQYLKCGNTWLRVCGVLQKQQKTGENEITASFSKIDNSVYAPLNTVLLRYRNSTKITEQTFATSMEVTDDGSFEEKVNEDIKINQLDRIIVRVSSSEYLRTITEIIDRLLLRRHYGEKNYEIIIPELLLQQEQETREIFNLVLGAIAGISLLVGGIGIMNIMLASVLERVKEIGIRLALGATKKDIVVQFLAEASFISFSGGIIGIIFGVVLSVLISHFADIPTIISATSILLSFGISVAVGIIFGFIPAKRASEKDPIVSLRA